MTTFLYLYIIGIMKTVDTLNMKAKKVKILLIEKDLTQAEIGRRLGYSKGMINHVIRGRVRHPFIEEAVARMLGQKPEELWKVA